MTIHTTVGVYSNKSFKTNGVDPQHLEGHIEYNKRFRPGRALFVDGVCVHNGYFSDAQIREEIQSIVDKIQPHARCTAPYH